MANNNMENISTGKPKIAGAVFVAPLGTAIPTDASTALIDAFANAGYVSEDGVTNTISTESEEIKAWGGDTVLTPQTGRTETFQLSLLEINETSLVQVFGEENVTINEESSAITVIGNSKERKGFVWVFEVALTGDRIMRTIVPCGKITEMGDIVFVDGEAIKFEITITALPDVQGNTTYRYIAKAA